MYERILIANDGLEGTAKALDVRVGHAVPVIVEFTEREHH